MVEEYDHDKLKQDLEKIRQDGQANMLDRNGVQRVANEKEMYQLVTFIEDSSSKEYVDLLRGLWR